MPGMLETVLNLGLNDASVEGLAERSANRRFAWDAYRRLIQMFGDVVRGVPAGEFEAALREARHRARRGGGHRPRRRRSAGPLRPVQGDLRRRHRGGIPRGAAATAARGDPGGVRLLEQREGDRLPADRQHPRRLGNGGDRPADGVREQGRRARAPGVAFSRDETSGAPQPSGDFLPDAQGEDVVAGIRNPRDLSELER